MTFEEFIGHDGEEIGAFYPGVHFEALSEGREDWIVSDVMNPTDPDGYNASSWPSGQEWGTGEYWIYDYVGAWTDYPGAGGKIVFDNGGAKYVELGYCCLTPLTLTAYDHNDNIIDTDTGPANLRYINDNESGPGTLGVDAPAGNVISYITIHDTGNYWIVDNITADSALEFTKVSDANSCVIPFDELTYTICWDNASPITFENAFIIDRLAAGIYYPGSD